MLKLLFEKFLKSKRPGRRYVPSPEGQKAVLKKTQTITFFLSIPIVIVFILMGIYFFERMRPETAIIFLLFFLLPVCLAMVFVFLAVLIALSLKQEKKERLENPVIEGETFESGRFESDDFDSDLAEQIKPQQKIETAEDFKFEESQFKFNTGDKNRSD
ncbi:MAG: hypothetical protein AB8G18_16155 [Gammaproteobacteria bacterium]